MPVMTVLEFEGVTREMYDRVGMSLPPAVPAGIMHHSCGPTATGWRIADIWQSRDLWNAFLDEHYLPAMLAAGGPAPSRREALDAYHAGVVRQPPVSLEP